MKCQSLFSGKDKKNISKCHPLKFYSESLVLSHMTERVMGAYSDNEYPDQPARLTLKAPVTTIVVCFVICL